MLAPGPAIRIVLHLNEDVSARADFLHQDILTFLFERRVAGATLLRPEAGFGSHHRLHAKGSTGAEADHLPVRIEFVDEREKVEKLLPDLLLLVTDGIVEMQETTILKVARGKVDNLFEA